MKHDSLLLNLMPELRSQIYRMTVIKPAPIDITKSRQSDGPALLATCRQIRAEALSIYYAENTFFLEVRCDYNWAKKDLCWFESLGIHRIGFITELQVECVNVDGSRMETQTSIGDFLQSVPWPPRGMSYNLHGPTRRRLTELAETGVKFAAIKFTALSPMRSLEDILRRRAERLQSMPAALELGEEV